MQRCYTCGRETPLGESLGHFDGCAVESIHSPLNACCFRDQCKAMERALAESRAEVAALRASMDGALALVNQQKKVLAEIREAIEGHRQTMEGLRKHVATHKARAERLAGALRGMMIAAPGGHECLEFHHDKADRHFENDDCRPMLRWSEAREAARAALEQEPQE